MAAKSSLKGVVCLVTGAGGFIGLQLCQALESNGAIVKRLLRKHTDLKVKGCFYCELGEQKIPVDAVRDVDIVFHLAGRAHSLHEGPDENDLYSKSNVKGTLDLLVACKNQNIKKFIYFSSVKAMGEENESCLNETSESQPVTPYGRSKLEAERLVLSGKYVPIATVLRLTMVYGVSDKGNLPKMIKAISNKRFPPYPKVLNKRSMIHVDDIIQCAKLVALSEKSAMNTYILNDGVEYSTRGIYEEILKCLGRKIPVWGVPIFILYIVAATGNLIQLITGKYAPIDLERLKKLTGNSYYSSVKAVNELGFQPKHTLYSSLQNIVNNLI